MNKAMLDMAVNGIGGRFAENPVPEFLVGIESGSAIGGFSHLIKLIPADDTVVVPLLVGGEGPDWYAAFAGNGPVFLRVDHGEWDKVSVADDLPPTAFANLVWIMSPGEPPDGSDGDFDLEVTFDPS